MARDGYYVWREVIPEASIEEWLLAAEASAEHEVIEAKQGDRCRLQSRVPPPLADEVKANVEDAVKKVGHLVKGFAKNPEAQKIKFLKSEAGCMQQGFHMDYDADFENPNACLGVLVALQPATSLMVKAGSHRRTPTAVREATPVNLDAGDILIFSGNLSHAGAAYETANYRIHAYVVPRGEQAPNNVVYTPTAASRQEQAEEDEEDEEKGAEEEEADAYTAMCGLLRLDPEAPSAALVPDGTEAGIPCAETARLLDDLVKFYKVTPLNETMKRHRKEITQVIADFKLAFPDKVINKAFRNVHADKTIRVRGRANRVFGILRPGITIDMIRQGATGEVKGDPAFIVLNPQQRAEQGTDFSILPDRCGPAPFNDNPPAGMVYYRPPTVYTAEGRPYGLCIIPPLEFALGGKLPADLEACIEAEHRRNGHGVPIETFHAWAATHPSFPFRLACIANSNMKFKDLLARVQGIYIIVGRVRGTQSSHYYAFNAWKGVILTGYKQYTIKLTPEESRNLAGGGGLSFSRKMQHGMKLDCIMKLYAVVHAT